MNAVVQSADPQPATSTGYSRERVRDCVAVIRAHAPTATAIRTDRSMPGRVSSENPLRMVVECAPKRRIALTIPYRDTGKFTGFVQREFSLDGEAARTVSAALRELGQLNSLGAWCLDPDANQTPLQLCRERVGTRDLLPDSYLAETTSLLAHDLPQVEAIEIDYLITQFGSGPHANQRRRSFIRFTADGGRTELAALDSGGFPLHARHQLLQPEDETHLRLNLSRMLVWAEQLSTTPDLLAENFGVLTFLASSLHLTRIALR